MTMEGGEDGLPIPEETLNEDDDNIGILYGILTTYSG